MPTSLMLKHGRNPPQKIQCSHLNLCFSLADTAVIKKLVRIFNYHKNEATPVFIHRFFKIQLLLFRVADRILRLSEQK